MCEALPCNEANLAAPYGTLDIDDVLGFLNGFAAGDRVYDLAPAYVPDGRLNVDDVLRFLTLFGQDCPAL